MHHVVSIIVTFKPDVEVLNALLKAIEPQVANIVVVDNNSPANVFKKIKQSLPDNGRVIEKGYNSGVSEAINTGISEAKLLGATHVVLFDQDSLPKVNMVEALLAAMEQKAEGGINVAAVGPKYTDVKGDHASPFVKLVGRRLQAVECGDTEIVPVNHLITSGCLFSIDALTDVGNMERKLFIDYVDIEWCFRAASMGYALFGVGSAKMQHDLGDSCVKVFGRRVTVHAPLRNYYMIRNGIWLMFLPSIPLNWKIMDCIRLVKIYFVFSLFAGQKFENWKMMNKALWHVFTGRMGKYID